MTDETPKPQIEKPTFNPETGVIDFGGMHLLHNYGDSMAHDTKIEHLIDSFIKARPDNELAFAQYYTGSNDLVAGGSGYQLKKPAGGYSETDIERINAFLVKMEELGDKIRTHMQSKETGPSSAKGV